MAHILELFLSVTIVFLFQEAVALSQQPMVAFMCNKPAVYLTLNGWVQDRTTDCLKNADQVLQFCRKVYPDKDITNVVEAPELVTVSPWCGYDEANCHQHNEHKVRPFRCLEGAFQSDALLVPQHCLFDHKHGTVCARYEEWNVTSQQSCQERDMKLESFAILQPCGTGVFSGVEFVCCPRVPSEQPPQQPVQVNVKPFISEDDQNLLSNLGPLDHNPNEWEPALPAGLGGLDKDFGAEENALFRHYLDDGDDDKYNNEHEYFIKAKGDLLKHHHDRVTKMMKEWSEARDQVQKMKKVDPKGAEKLNQEISQRFQKTYEALEQEGQMEKQQILAVHEQRVHAKLNSKKRDAIEDYMEALTEPKPDASDILKQLIRYVKAEEKDRLHSVNHFLHLQTTGTPEELDVARQQTIQHLDIIDERIKEAIDMLARVPSMEKKIRTQIEDYIATFVELDREVEAVRAKVVTPAEEPVDMPVQLPPQEEPKQASGGPATLHHVELSAVDPAPVNTRVLDDETQEDEHAPIAAHLADARLQVQVLDEQKFSVEKQTALYATGTSVAIAVAALAIFIILLLGVLVLRRRSHRRPSTAVEVTASPEEKHVANMQMNGYENPTYRYFEMNTKA